MPENRGEVRSVSTTVSVGVSAALTMAWAYVPEMFWIFMH